MKFKFLLLLFSISCGILSAQEPYRSLVITEARLGGQPQAYIELTNMGDQTINLSEFEIGKVTPWTAPVEVEGGLEAWTLEDWFQVGENDYMMLPDVELAPGESYVIASVADWRPEMELIDPFQYGYQPTKKEMEDLADFGVHYAEPPGQPPADSITPKYQVLEVWNGRDCWYVRHHFTETDSAVIDQVGGVFDEDNGTNKDGAYDVAGVTEATNTHTLVRKASITQGNLNFRDGRGTDLADSEWIPVPNEGQNAGRRAPYWTIGNHGAYVFDDNTLVSDEVDVNLDNLTITVPWGTQRNDSLIAKFEKKPGISWQYHYSPVWEDSAHLAIQNGDSLSIFVCGETLQRKDFALVVADPTDDANIVVPKKGYDDETGDYGAWSAGLYAAFCRVTSGADVDTIKNSNNLAGLGFATRTDSLLKYLEKAPNATWEFIWVDGMERADLKDGDILKVTAENGDVKEYYIWINDYLPSHEAHLASITWPDIPGFYKGIFGWIGDTIPNFVETKYDYRVRVPSDVEGIPALVAHPVDLNQKIEVDRATNLFGTIDERTLTYTSTAEDDTTVLTYKITFEKDKLPKNVQPYHAEPFISEFIFWEQWNNGFVEICNPGNQPLDLSDYMFFNGYENNPAVAISGWDSWGDRYVKYIPGYKWTSSEAEWTTERHMAEPDLNVNPIVQPGDVFVMAEIRTTSFSGYPWFASQQTDIDFRRDPWGEGYSGASVARQWKGANFYMYKILNDSIKQGLKPATDPNDFELVATFGSGDGSDYAPLGVPAQMINSFERKPEYFQPKAGLPSESFGSNPEDSEWTMTDRLYFQQRNAVWPNEILFVADGIGSHFFNEVTIYKSTVTSKFYKVSEGYSHNEQIQGIVTGTSVVDFLANLTKADEGQTLTVKSGEDGSELSDTDVIANADSLIVMSADSANITKYLLEVTDEGLSDDAVLTSDMYDITADVEAGTGTIGGFDYGTKLRVVIEGLNLPAGASMMIIDDEGFYVPLKRLNFDTTYVDVLVNDEQFVEVTAEDGIKKIVYAITPNAEPSDAFVTSSVYMVDQENLLIDLVPEGTTVPTLLNNLVPSRGASVKVVDKLGGEREMGNVVLDDKIVVTAQDGVTTRTYYLTLLGKEPVNLAYLLSDVYEVDQLTLTVYVPRGESNPTIAELLADLELSSGATVDAMDANGADKADTEVVAEGDILKVTAANGITTANYTVMLVTSVDPIANNIRIYPNPTSGMVYVSGLEAGTRIHVYNTVGMRVLDQMVRQGQEIISLENQTSGLYFIVVTDNDNVVGRYKLILK